MSNIKLHEQLTFLRKQKNITQEELAQIFNVTNQSVSKWESGACCPDINILPDIAAYFNVSVDELLGYKPAETFEDIYLKIKGLFAATPEKEVFDLAYKLAFVLHEGAMSHGYRKSTQHWDYQKLRSKDEDFYKWGYSCCNEPEGATLMKANSVFISSNKIVNDVSSMDVIKIFKELQAYAKDKNVLRVFFGLYELTLSNEELHVSIEDISKKCGLSVEKVSDALDVLPVRVKLIENGADGYRIEGPYMHIPSLLRLFNY